MQLSCGPPEIICLRLSKFSGHTMCVTGPPGRTRGRLYAAAFE